MKKILIGALCAMFGFSAMALQYQVYDLKFTAKTTAAKGLIEDCDCGDYCYREKSTTVIKGVLGGCGCEAIYADGGCPAAILYMWDETRKLPITNVNTKTGWKVQRVGKKQTVVENLMHIEAYYGPDDMYYIEFWMSGFGTYKNNTKDETESYATSICGNFAGVASAPYYNVKGTCGICSSTPDQMYITTAVALCTSCGEAEYSDYTPFYGTYTVKYNSSKTSKVRKSGLSDKNFGLPSYVGVDDYVATNIGD